MSNEELIKYLRRVIVNLNDDYNFTLPEGRNNHNDYQEGYYSGREDMVCELLKMLDNVVDKRPRTG